MIWRQCQIRIAKHQWTIERTCSRFIDCIALSIPLTTDAMLPVTCLMVTAVSTLEATASIRLPRRSKFKLSLFLRMALDA